MYLAVVIDLFSRMVVGWATSAQITASLVTLALERAVIKRCPLPVVLLHSDRRVQYTSKEYRHVVQSYGMRQSMSRLGNCWDNAVAESFFRALRVELIHDIHLQTRDETNKFIFKYIEEFYRLSWLTASLVSVLLAILLINRFIISRLYRIGLELTEIRRESSFCDRIKVVGNDELSSLAKDINGTLDSLSNAHQQITLARDSAETANATKSQFLASVSHELRTPIHGVLGLLRMLYKSEKSSSRRAYLQMAYSSSDGLLNTINDLLDISKAEAGKLTLAPKSFSLRHVMREVLQAVGPHAQEKPSIAISCVVDPALPSHIIADNHRLRQVLINLAGNAVKFTNTGLVTLSAHLVSRHEENVHIKFSCKDSGIGIPHDQLSTIFDAYSQADSSKAGRPLGTGLGLSVVKQIVELMGGTITVTSEIDVGSEFTFEIEVLAQGEHHVPQAHTNNILVCSDNDLFVRALDHSVHPFGISLVRATNFSEKNILMPVIVDGSLLDKLGGWQHLRTITSSAKDKVIVLLGVDGIVHREELDKLSNITTLIRPCLGDDIYAALNGNVTSDQTTNGSIMATTTIGGLAPLNILVADDNNTNQIVLVGMLEEAGHKVTTVYDGVELLNKWREEKFDIIMTDIEMPRLDGIGATKVVRQEESSSSGESIPILAITAHAFPEERQRMIDQVITEVITKPVDPNKVKKIFTEIFKERVASTSSDSRSSVQKVSDNQALNYVTPESHSSENDIITAEQPVIDFESIMTRCSGRTKIALKVVESFSVSIEELAESLLRAVESTERIEIRKKAHAIKGMILEVGCQSTAAIAEWMEKNAESSASFEELESVSNAIDVQVKLLVKSAREVLVAHRGEEHVQQSTP